MRPFPSRWVLARLRRGLFWSAALCGVLAVVGGLIVALQALDRSETPAGAVQAYFAALQRGDAPGALAMGELPAGPRTLLTSTVLAEQQRIAPIRDVQVIAVNRTGARASVVVRYRLGFPEHSRAANGTVPVVQRDGTWRLQHTAVATELRVRAALERASIVGAGIPVGTVLLFPGAVPISFDSPYLQVDPDHGTVEFDPPPRTDVDVQLSRAGRDAVAADLDTMLGTCLSSEDPDARCPLPSDRVVPGTLRGKLTKPLAGSLRVDIQGVGLLVVTGTASVRGSYRELDFNNVAQARSGTVDVPLRASGYAASPLTLQWQQLS